MGRTAVLVDGFNPCQGVKAQRGRRYLWLDDVAAAGRQQTYLEARALPSVQCPLDQLRGEG